MSGRVSGSVVDATGAPVPNADVSLYLLGGSKPLLKTKSASNGTYNMIGVRPADYDVNIEAPGFVKATVHGIAVDAARETAVPQVKLQLATVTFKVDVNAAEVPVDVANAEISGTISMDEMKDTTASIYFTKKKNPEVDLGHVRVPAKIIVLRSQDPVAEEALIASLSLVVKAGDLDDAGERRAVAARIEPSHVRRRRGPHHRQHPLDRLQHARHATERQRRRDEPDDFAVVVSLETPDDLYRIGRRIGVVEIGVEPIQHRFQFNHRLRHTNGLATTMLEWRSARRLLFSRRTSALRSTRSSC
jgi:hypothetical protein